MKISKRIVTSALVDAGATAAYVVGIATFLSSLETFFGGAPKKPLLAATVMLLLLVISAAITGFAVFGKPVMWYLDGKKKEAMSLLSLTIGFLALITLLVIGALAF